MTVAVATAARSDELHARVLGFALRGEGSFDDLALAIARHQADACAGHSRLLDARGGRLASLDDVPAVPVEAFRMGRVAVHSPSDDVARFDTSGTTGADTGSHHFRTLGTYRALALALGRAHLLGESPRGTVVALAPPPPTPQRSSLGYMMAALVEELDGRGLGDDPFEVGAPERWLHRPPISLDGFERAVDVSRSRGEPLVVLATAFACADLLERSPGRRASLPPGSVVMLTGGFKGRAREIPEPALRAAVAERLGAVVVGEYGMTELSSQLWESPGGCGSPAIRYVPPPWLRVAAVDHETLAPLPVGKRGLACFTDLANVDSALRVLTHDEIVVHPEGVELVGRARGAPPRGCSLAVEAWLGS